MSLFPFMVGSLNFRSHVMWALKTHLQWKDSQQSSLAQDSDEDQTPDLTAVQMYILQHKKDHHEARKIGILSYRTT